MVSLEEKALNNNKGQEEHGGLIGETLGIMQLRAHKKETKERKRWQQRKGVKRRVRMT